MAAAALTLAPAGTDPALLDGYARLFARCFPGTTHLDARYLDWLYRENPCGTVVGFDAWEGATLAAHYVCIPVDAVLDGVAVRALLSLNTATDPDFQGRGLFTRLAEATYELGARLGYGAVYGVANVNSTPGFLRKLGFTLVRPLDARLGFGRAQPSAWDEVLHAARFRRAWSHASLAWRIASPARPYRLVRIASDTLGAATGTGRPGIQAWAELPAACAPEAPFARGPLAVKLHLGLTPRKFQARRALWFDIPSRLRPSPLNLIFRPLAQGAAIPDGDGVLMNVLDFDAY